MSLSHSAIDLAWKELDHLWDRDSFQLEKLRLIRNYRSPEILFSSLMAPEITLRTEGFPQGVDFLAPRIFCDSPLELNKPFRSTEYRWFIETVRHMKGGEGYEIHIEHEFNTLEEAVAHLIGSFYGALAVLSLSKDIQ